jgi:hypothetical protein
MSEPVTASLRPYTWSDQESVGYEAAIEAINAVVGAYNARITREKTRPVAEQDGAAIARWRQECGACQRRREGLEPTDHGQIAAVRREYTRRLDNLRRNAQ